MNTEEIKKNIEKEKTCCTRVEVNTSRLEDSIHYNTIHANKLKEGSCCDNNKNISFGSETTGSIRVNDFCCKSNSSEKMKYC